MTTRQIGAEFTTTTTTSPTDLIEILTHDSVLNQWVPKNIAVQNFLSNVDSLTPEGVVFGGSDGKLAQDISFTYDTADKQLMLQNMFVGTLSADGELIVATSGGPSTFGSAINIFATSNGSGDTTSITNLPQSGSYTYTIPDAGADSQFVITNSNQTINGFKTFTNDVTIKSSKLNISATDSASTLQFYATPNGVDYPTFVFVTNAPQLGSPVYTIPAAGADSDFVMTNGDQTLNGAKTFNNEVTISNTNLLIETDDITSSTIQFYASNNIGDYTTVITNAPQGGNYIYTFPDGTTDAEFVLTEGHNQTINGQKTFTNNLNIQGANLFINTAGNGIQIKGGSNARIGQSTLVGGTVTIANTTITAQTRVSITRADINLSTALGSLTYIKNPGISFTITSLNPTILDIEIQDESSVDWQLFEEV